MNKVQIYAVKSPYAFISQTLSAIALAVILGMLTKTLVSESVYTLLNAAVLEPVHYVFMNALIIVVAPIVFFITRQQRITVRESFGVWHLGSKDDIFLLRNKNCSKRNYCSNILRYVLCWLLLLRSHIWRRLGGEIRRIESYEVH